MQEYTTALDFVHDGERAKAVGLIVLQADETIENELRPVFDEAPLYHSRIPSAPQVNAATLARMEAEIPKASALLPPAANFAAIGYACTSGAAVIGGKRISAAVQSVHPQATVTHPLCAAVAAFAALGAHRLALISPYIAAVSDAVCDHFAAHGLLLVARASFEREDEAAVARISEASVLDAISRIGTSCAIDAVFVSCTNLRSFSIIEAAEARIGKPVLSSNQVLAWHLLRLAGYHHRKSGLGTLFAAH